MKRCPNGTRRNKKTGECVVKDSPSRRTGLVNTKKRCPNGSRRNKKTGNCDPTNPGAKDRWSSTKRDSGYLRVPKTLKDYFTVRVIGKGKKAGYLKIKD